ncbi:MAG: penicillin-binding protein 1B [Gammaproteobacteria bacterium]|nr:penicillin-binding protein 1B [Gammaproteobacteria bacterium]
MAVSRRRPPSRHKSRTERPPERRRSGWRALAFYLRHLLLWLAVGVAAYWLWLDREVARTFESRQWSLPARVYARPLELFPGAAVTSARLRRELERLGYRQVSRPTARGQFAVHDQDVEVFARGFDFWDIPEPQRRFRATFDHTGIATLQDVVSGEALGVLRLDPVEIGSINPHRFEDRKLLRYDDLPPRFVAALVAVEDHRYFDHFGVDVLGLARAMLSNLRAQRWVQGGSTLTQQLVKNFYLTRERTLSRKLTEMLMALSLEWRFDKQSILETYVNEVFLGQDGNRAIHGFELAAQFYFGKPLAELDIASMAVLIGMIKGPSAYDPRRHPDTARARRDVVLDVLLARHVIEAGVARAARAQPIELRPARLRGERGSPAFMALVKRQLLAEYSATDLNAAGLNIYTTLDADLQARVEQRISTTLDELERNGHRRDLQTALVIVDPHSGEVLAIVGDRNPGYAGFNRAVDARRPVGSVIKPFVYAKALAQPSRYALFTPLDDVAVTWTAPNGDTWQPKNFDGREHGRLPLLEALTRSLNLATVNLGLELGLPAVRDFLRKVGFGDDLPAYPSILLGAIDMSPLLLAEAYTALANDGFKVPLRAISDVTDHAQHKLKRYGLQIEHVMEPATAALVRFAMTRVVAEGTARGLLAALPDAQPLAGKTGTSNDNRDSWFAGFGANRLAVAWVGRDDNSVTGLTGSSGALRVWVAAMREAGVSALDLQLPAGLEWRRVDLARGVALPEECANGERVPVHRDTALPSSATCTETPPAQDQVPGMLERLRGFFGR